MSKFLIQDIVPAEKKHRNASHAHKSEEITDMESDAHLMHRGTNVHESLAENPRRMLIDQLEKDSSDVAKSSTKAAQHTTRRRAPAAKPWAYGLVTGEEAGLPPPPTQFEEPRARDSDWDGKKSKWLPWIIGIVIVAVLGFFVLNFFAGATVMILPKHDAPIMDKQFTALKNSTGIELPYAILIETASSSLEVPATGEKTVVAKATGRIVVYNEQATAQRLIKNTRFQSPAGKIYRINESISIPKAMISGGKSSPGFLEVTIFADEAGPEYNSDPVDFTLPGLKGSATYNKVYARSKGAISGGAMGTIKTVSDQDLKQASQDLRVQLETKLRSKARGDLAINQITYDQGVVIDLKSPELSKLPASADNKAIITEEGSIYLVTFKRTELTQAIVKTLEQDYKGEPVEIKNLDTLQFSMEAQKGGALLNANELSFRLKGVPELSWVIDDAAVKRALLAAPKDGFNGVLAQFPAVEQAKATIRPMWKSSFPTDPGQISVVLVDKIPD